MSHYIFKGRLCGYVCAECPEPLANLQVRLYRVDKHCNIAALAVANPKETFAILDDDQVQGKESRLLAKAETDAEGNFTFELGKNYAGEAFEVDVYCGSVPRQKIGKNPPKPRQFTITTLQLRYRETENGFIAVWNYCLPHRFWCAVLAWFDVWTICGRVLDCKTKQPVMGVKVKAFDADWLADDNLGFGVTNAAGKFIITYAGVDFRQGTWIDVELIGGPDLYFKIEDAGGNPLLTETQADGRAPSRENAGHCFCVELCIKDAPPITHAWFTRVGDFALYSDINFLTNGRTTHAVSAHGGPGFGFFGNLELVGDCPTTYPTGGPPMRYRFLYESGGGLQPILATNIVSVAVGSRPITWDVFGTGPIVTSQTIRVAGSGATPPGPTPPPAILPPPGTPWGQIPDAVLVPDADGWVTMDPATTNGGFSGPLLKFVSTTVVPGGTAPSSGPGVSPADPKNGTMLRIVFEAEPVTGPTILSPTLTNELAKLYVNNWSAVNDLNLLQFIGVGNTPCSGLANSIDILYAADHELMASWSLHISTVAIIPGGDPVLPSGTIPRGGVGTEHLDISTWPKCSYSVTLSTRRMLTDGETDDPTAPNTLTFCKD
jgi:hypothetical protein